MGASTLEQESSTHAKLRETQWRQLIIRSLKGESDKDLSHAFGVQVGTIRQRRYSDPVWGAAHDALRASAKASKGESQAVELKAVKPATPSIFAAVQAPPSPLTLSEIASQHPESVAKYAHGLIQQSIEQGLIAPPTTVSEFKSLVEVVRKSCGLDDKTNNVNITLWSGGSVAPAPSIAPTLEAEIVSQKEPDDWI